MVKLSNLQKVSTSFKLKNSKSKADQTPKLPEYGPSVDCSGKRSYACYGPRVNSYDLTVVSIPESFQHTFQSPTTTLARHSKFLLSSQVTSV